MSAPQYPPGPIPFWHTGKADCPCDQCRGYIRVLVPVDQCTECGCPNHANHEECETCRRVRFLRKGGETWSISGQNG